jgi:hypothetical protein
MNRVRNILLVQLLGFLVVCSCAGFFALISFGVIGGVSMGLSPESTFKLVEGVVCPEGSTVEYYEKKHSYHEPGEAEPHVECVSADGEHSDVTLPAIGSVLGGSFLLCFLPICLPGGLLVLILPPFFIKGKRQKETSAFQY